MYDFGYTWFWQYGHLVPMALFGALAAAGWRWKWKRWVQALSLVGVAWSGAGLAIVQTVMRLNTPMELPTASFFASGQGRVLDVGSGSGRSTIMVALARPAAEVVALDRFAQGYGIEQNGPARLGANLRAAGVEKRVKIQEADMRQMPFADGSFDAAVSAYAIDHLGREGFQKALGEVSRVLRPGGEFLFFTINRDWWVKVAYPFLHGGYYGPTPAAERWRAALTASGAFEVVEQGTQPGTMYFLVRKIRK